MRRTAEHRVAALEAMVRKYQSMVFSIALRITGDRGAAEEAAQDVFLALDRHLENLQSEEHTVFWLRKVAVHRATDYRRRFARMPERQAQDIADLPGHSHNGDALQARTLQHLVACLPEKLRSTIVLRYQEDMMPEEIAATLEMPVATVKSNLQRGLELLRRKGQEILR